jgi:hypothetical protein
VAHRSVTPAGPGRTVRPHPAATHDAAAGARTTGAGGAYSRGLVARTNPLMSRTPAGRAGAPQHEFAGEPS